MTITTTEARTDTVWVVTGASSRAYRTLTLEKITALVANFFGVSIEELKGPRGNERLATARKAAWWLAREFSPDSIWKDLGDMFCRNKETPRAGVRAIKGWIETDRPFAAGMAKLYAEALKEAR